MIFQKSCFLKQFKTTVGEPWKSEWKSIIDREMADYAFSNIGG